MTRTVVSIKDLAKLLDLIEEINGSIYAYEDFKDIVLDYRIRYGLLDQK